ncbi:MAG: SDR family oxidoreductase [Pseudomonadota bacterium]
MDQKNPPPQHQVSQPGIEAPMRPHPQSSAIEYVGSGKLAGKVAIVTGGDSGIGKSVAIAFAKEGADVLIVYLNEHADANDTKDKIEAAGKTCLLFPGDVGDENVCKLAVTQAVSRLGRLDILINNAGEQHPKESILDISGEQLERTFRTNIYSMFYMTKAALPHLKEGSCIVNTTSITAYRGSPHLLDYSATKGAIVAFTRSLSKSLVKKGIRVNAVAPGPVWTPLIPSTFDAQEVAHFGSNVPMERPGQPDEIAPCYVFLSSNDSSFMSGQVLHPNGGEVVNG